MCTRFKKKQSRRIRFLFRSMDDIPQSSRNAQRAERRRKLLGETLHSLPAVFIFIIHEYATTRLLYWGISGATSAIHAVRIFDVVQVTNHGKVLGTAVGELQSGQTAAFDLLGNRRWYRRTPPCSPRRVPRTFPLSAVTRTTSGESRIHHDTYSETPFIVIPRGEF